MTKGTQFYHQLHDKKRPSLENDYTRKLNDSSSIISGSDWEIAEAKRRYIDDLRTKIPLEIYNLRGLDRYSQLLGEYFASIYSAIDEIDEATDRAYNDQIVTKGLPKCSNCKYARWDRVDKKRKCQCTLNWNDGPRDYLPPDYSCSKFEWK